jgi:ribosomal-protein-alanine N-acetyltransferase
MTHAAAITLLPAGPADALPLAQLSRDLVEQGLPWSWRPERVIQHVREPESVVLLARSGPEIAGFGIMRYRRVHAHLNLLAVAPRWRRAGIGRRIVAWLEETALVAGLEWIDLELRAGNRGARQFYENLGYGALEYVPGYYQGRESALRMRRRLRERAPARLDPDPDPR